MMNILYAQINSQADEADQAYFRQELSQFFIKQGFEKVYFTYSALELIECLQDNKDKVFWLFSNFPPNSSYVEGAMPEVNTETSMNYWLADGYEQSYKLFDYALNLGSIKFWNLITGAPYGAFTKRKLSALNKNIPLNIITKRTLMHNGDYYDNLFRYLQNTVKRIKLNMILKKA